MGLKPSQVKALERLYRRRVPPDELVTSELARLQLELSRDIRRQIGVLINRIGEPAFVIIGDERGLMIPDLVDYPLGKRLLRGLRLIHTHLKQEPLTDDDLTDLAMLRLDLVAALTDGDSPRIQVAWLTPANAAGLPCHVDSPRPLSRLQPDFATFIADREAELAKAAPPAAEIRGAAERGILISVTQESREEVEDSLAELQELARTAGVQVLESTVQRPRQLNPRFLMGEGKMRDVVIRALQLGATMLVFDQELSPAQVRSISAMTELKVIDRSQLILDIFARRATSLDGKVQVELAQLKYLLPRLTGRGVQMSRLMGGIGGRGPGETKLEIDRRRIRDRIAKLERTLRRPLPAASETGTGRSSHHFHCGIHQCGQINPP
jgi:GTP-binding protein HflX